MNDDREKLLTKLQALLEMTERNGCTEAEAALAADHAARLMQKHGLSLADLKAASPTDVCCLEGLKGGKRHTHEVQWTVPIIARFTQTRTWLTKSVLKRSKAKKQIEVVIQFFGIKNDVAIAIFLAKTFQQALDLEWTRYWTKARAITLFTEHAARKGFMIGMTDRLNDRLNEMIRQREIQGTSENDCRAIVVLKEDVIAKAFADLGVKFDSKVRNTSHRIDPMAYRAGHEAGAGVSFTAGRLN